MGNVLDRMDGVRSVATIEADVPVGSVIEDDVLELDQARMKDSESVGRCTAGRTSGQVPGPVQ